jgi:hypothetical protein
VPATLALCGIAAYLTVPERVTSAYEFVLTVTGLHKPVPVLTRMSGSGLVSSDQVLADVGKTPAVVNQHAFASFPESEPAHAIPATSGSPEKEQPAGTVATDKPKDPEPRGRSKDLPRVVGTDPKPKRSPALVETQVIPQKEPSGVSESNPQSAAPAAPGAKEAGEKGSPARPAVTLPPKGPVQRPGPRKDPEADGRAEEGAQGTRGTSASQKDSAGKGERFQLPGSLAVKIKNYRGTPVKWAMMVILDDSGSMGRKSSVWGESRGQASKEFVSKIAAALPPNSRLAVRDFHCSEEDAKKGKPCLSRMLFDWTSAPFKQLKEKLDAAGGGGITNPCAAATFAVKKDLPRSGEVAPRVLIVTNGAGKCAYKDVVHAISHRDGGGKVTVDVVALGIGQKHRKQYSQLPKETEGLFFAVENPSDLATVATKYEKILNSPAMEKLEIRGDKAVFTVRPEEEITLAPGSYTVILPVVNQLNPANRTLPNKISVNSGQSTTVQVIIKKGKPAVSTETK